MPALGPEFAAATYDHDDVALVEGDTFVLRTRRAGGYYDPASPRADFADVLLQPMDILGLKELFSFGERAVTPPGTSVGYQIGLEEETTAYDGTLMFWDGAAWASAGEDDFSPATDVDAHFPTLYEAAGRGRHVQMRFRLTSDSRHVLTPKVRPPALGLEIEHRPYEDIRRSLWDFIVANIPTDQFLIHRPDDDGTTEIELDTDLKVLEVLHVYNLDDDPERLVDLLATASGKNVTLTGPQPAASKLEVIYRGRPETTSIWAAPADPVIFTSKIPSISIALVNKTREFRHSNALEQSVSRERLKARIRWAPDLGLLTAQVRCLSANDAEASNWAEAVVRMFQEKRCRYLPTGEPMELVRIGDFIEDDIVSRGTACKRTDVTLRYRRWHDDYTETALIQRVRLFVSSGGGVYEEKLVAGS